MKSFRLLKFALILSTSFVFSSANANKGIFNANAMPSEFFTHTPTLVTISAELGTENPPTTITAYQTTHDGKPITPLGRLLNKPNKYLKNRYALQINLNKPAQETIYIRVIADYGGDPHVYYSPILPINAYDPIPTWAVQQFESDLKTLKKTFLQRLRIMPIAAARIQAYLDAKQNPNIYNAHLSDVYLSVIFKHGVRGAIKLDEYELPVNSTPHNKPVSYTYPDNNQLLIFAPGYSDTSPQNQIADLAMQLFKQSNYLHHSPAPITLKQDTDATLEVIKHWGDYRAVILHTHGGIWSLHNSEQEVTLLSGTSSTAPLTQQNSLDLSAGRIGIKGVDRFIIFPTFINKHATTMKNTFFYLGACYSLANDSMWQALKDKGAKLAFGWSNSVARGFNQEKFKQVIKPMLAIDSSNTALTAKQAYDAIYDKVDGWCLLRSTCLGGDGARLLFKTASPAWQNFSFYDATN
jgi:hypothetical protein